MRMTFPANRTAPGRRPPSDPFPGALAHRERVLPAIREIRESGESRATRGTRSLSSLSPSTSPGPRAFTLMELLVVMAIIGILLAAAIPAIKGLTGATALSTATRQVSNLITLARTEAIARNTITRLAVASDWPDDPNLDYRKVSIWAWDRTANVGSATSASGGDNSTGRMTSTSGGAPVDGAYVMISDWETLPSGVVFETENPPYLRAAAYVTDDPGTVRVNHPLAGDGTAATFTSEIFGGQTVAMDYFEFKANGSARLPGGDERAIALVLTEGFRPDGADSRVIYTNPNQIDGTPNNWAQINTSNLTGRVKIYRP